MDQNYSIKSIVEMDDPNKLVEEAKNLAERLQQDEGTRTQIRRLFGTLRQIEMSWPTKNESLEDRQQRDDAYRQLVLFGPRLAYESSPDRHPSMISLTKTIQEGIKAVRKDDRRTMQRLVQFFEAVVAFNVSAPKPFRGGDRR
jgi:CRISPR-associated protein Csm2